MSDHEDIPPHVRSEGKRRKSRRSRRQQGVHGQTPETGTNVETTSPPSGVHLAAMATLLPILATWGAMYEASNQPSTSFAHTAIRSPKHKRKRKASSRVPSPYLSPTKSRSPSQHPYTATPPPPYSATAIEEILNTADMEDQMNDPSVPSTSRRSVTSGNCCSI
ncbi:hypothetical protein RB195_021540 [Necator americanus]|uniref:Uncharacterized protein n=1 Tax=Necator americanus TaxID=51031 RepID=A0ABR1EBJ7_NECAM